MAEQRRVGAYEILSRLGAGGMAETFVAERRGPGGFAQRVCLKRIRPDSASDPELVRQFHAEAELLARLRHAAITQVIDFGQDQGDYFLALELIDGVDLRELIESHPNGLPADIVHYIALELATALDFAHRAGGDAGAGPIVHRDVSSSNVLLSSEGEVKLSDFGIARSLSAPKHTQTGIVRGKVPYLAPEYARSGRCDERCDLFALGVLLYECLSGERPHDGATELETLERAARAERTPLAQLAKGAPAELIALVEELLEPEPELRTQSAASLIEALLALPGSARARRELGQRVQRAQAARPARAQLDAQGSEPVARTVPYEPAPDSDAPAATSSTGAASFGLGGARLRVSRGAIAALLAAVALALTVTGLAISRREASGAPEDSERAASRNEAARSAAEPVAAPVDGQPSLQAVPPTTLANPGTAPERPIDRAPTTVHPAPAVEQAAQAATLTVVVLPFGYVNVDGRELGRTPVSVSLPPGEHAINARSNDRVFTRKITLAPAEQRRVVLQ